MKHRRDVPKRGDPFARIEQAAEAAADEVLAEDRALRRYGKKPPHGRNR